MGKEYIESETYLMMMKLNIFKNSYEKYKHVIWKEKLRENEHEKVRPEVSLWKAGNSSNHDGERIYRIRNIPEDEEVELAEPDAAAAEQPLGPHDVETAAGELGT